MTTKASTDSLPASEAPEHKVPALTSSSVTLRISSVRFKRPSDPRRRRLDAVLPKRLPSNSRRPAPRVLRSPPCDWETRSSPCGKVPYVSEDSYRAQVAAHKRGLKMENDLC